MTAIDTSLPAAVGTEPLGHAADRVFRTGMVVGLVAAAVSVAMWVTGAMGADVARFSRSYLFAFLFTVSISLGAYFFVAIQFVTRAGWSVTIRRTAEAMFANFQWLWILFIPLLLWAATGYGKYLYGWMDPAKVAVDELYQGKQPYLNVPRWIIAGIVYMVIWALVSRFYFRTSVRQDATGDPNLTLRMQKFAPVALLLFALTLTFASFDWIMALEAHWYSTIFGVYFFAASCCAFFSALILAVFFLQRSGRLPNEVTKEHWQDMGKKLFAFGVVFHAYIAFSQFMLIWYAAIPEGEIFYIPRVTQPWLGFFYLLAVGHFFLPFVLLVTKHTKRIPAVLASIAVWMLLMHGLDLYLLVMPVVPDEIADVNQLSELQALITAGEADTGFDPHPLDLTLLVAMLSFVVAMTARNLKTCRLIPAGDPRLGESMRFENM